MANNGGNTTGELVEYYSNLLISQYNLKPKAVATVQVSVTPIIMPGTSVETIAFAPVPTGGSFELAYDGGTNFVTINWNDSASTIQAKLRGLAPAGLTGGNPDTVFSDILNGGSPGTTSFADLIDGGTAFGWNLSQIVVTGSIASGLLTVTFVGVQPPAAMLVVLSNSLTPSPIQITITETDLTMPLAVLNGFSLS